MARSITTSRAGRRRSRATRRPRCASTRRSSRSTARRRSSSPSPRRSTQRTARARNAPHQREVQAFLERFTACMTSGDGDGVVQCFELPSLIVMSDPKYGQSQVLQEPQKLSSFFTQAPDMYAQKGIATTIPDIESLDWLSDALGLVTVRFPYIDADGNDLGDSERSLYVLRRDNNGELAICAAITLGTDSDRTARRKGTRKPVGHEGDQLA